MDFSLSSSLVSSAVSNPDKLSLDLQFATDKTLTARKGPTPVFARASTGRFVGSNGLIQSAAINAPRFDHDPVTGVCKGLLMEESRTNLLSQSESFDSTPWSAVNSTISMNSIASPDGLVTADKLIPNVGSTAARSSQVLTLTGSHTMSVFAKAAEWNWAIVTPSVAIGQVSFNLATGTVGTQSAGCVGSIVSFGNGWYRCSVTVTGTGVSSTARVSATNADNVFTAGDGTSGIYAWGAQLELGAFPTSYIPTTTGTLARSADVCSISGGAFTQIWNGVDISVLFKGVRQAATNGNYWAMSSGTQATAVQADRGATTERLAVAATGIISFTGLGANQSIRTAYAIKQGDFAGSLNGSGVTTSSNPHSPAFTSMYIGASYTGSILGAAWISEMKTFRKRLPNAKLQTLTV